MGKWLRRIRYILLLGPTLEVRFFFALISIGWAVDFYLDAHPESGAAVVHLLAPDSLPSNVFWGTLFFLYSFMLLKGLLGRYGIVALILEGVLGWIIWTLMAFTYWMVEGHPGPSLGGAMVATWLLIRYPTHWEDRRG